MKKQTKELKTINILMKIMKIHKIKKKILSKQKMFKTNDKTCEEKSIHTIAAHKEHNKSVL